MPEKVKNNLDIAKVIDDVLATIDREREREIISRRFGLFERKETLEQIGELLGITRERVRQLEKSVIARLKVDAEQGKLPHITEVEQRLQKEVTDLGHVARILNLSAKLTEKNTKIDQSRVAFLAMLCPSLTMVEDNDHFYHSTGLVATHDSNKIREHVTKIVELIKKGGEPVEIKTVAEKLKHKNPERTQALATVSKNLATLNNRPKNIRDKIYVILKEKGQHMHFNDIAGAIKDSNFKRKDVTTQAIHNELIKDKRFVLIGRGIYALKEWGYEKGTVADIISGVLREAGAPLHRDEIVRRVLKSRYVKETTILLNLQGKPQFKRVAKATYSITE
jgi:hypothetical protein